MIENDPLDNRRTIETRYGRLITPGDQDVIGHFLARCGEWAWDEATFVASTLPDDPRVLDVGAFLGTFGLGLALHKHLSFLCLVEANPTILPLLEANIQANAMSPAVVIGAIVSGMDTTLRPGRGDPLNLGSTSFAKDTNGFPTEPPDRALTLADLRREHGHFDLIKLDVEGMEHEILYCDRDHLAKGKTTLWVECNESPRSLELAELLLSWGLETYYFAFPSHNPDNFCGESEPVFPWGYEAGLLAAPKKPPRLDAELIAHGCILRQIGTVEDLREAMWCTPRGLPTELAHASAPELAAIAGRALQGQSRDVFLAVGGVLPKETVWDRLKATEAGLSRAEALVFERQDQLNQERERREAAEAGLSRAETLAFERQDQLKQERERREATERRLAGAVALALTRLEELGAEREHSAATTARLEQAESRVHAAERQLEDTSAQLSAQLHAAERQLEDASAQLVAIRSTVMWRINIFIGSRPRIHAALRGVRPIVGAMLRWRRRGAMT